MSKYIYLISIIAIFIIFIFSGCGGKTFSIKKVTSNKQYSIYDLSKESFNEYEKNLYFSEYSVSSLIKQNDPYKKLQTDLKSGFKYICSNHGGKIEIDHSSDLTRIIKMEFERHQKTYISHTKFASINDYKRFLTDKSYYTVNIEGTTAPQAINQYACKVNNTNLFYYAISDTYTDFVSKGLSGISANWWTMNAYIHIPN